MTEPEEDVVLPETEAHHRVALRTDGELVQPAALCQRVELLQFV